MIITEKTLLRTCGIFLVLAFAFLAQAQTSTPIRYFYDDMGRLIKVVDQAGSVATYSYDAVGNVLKITRSTVDATAPAILNFTPQRGGIGATITIRGQGFNPTPAQNLVTFNGSQALVVSATTSVLVVTVPSNATSGPISVTVNSQTASSDTDFIFVPAPAILSIAPRAVSSSPSITTTNLTVNGANLAGASFTFQPASVPPALLANVISVDPSGTSAILSVTIAANVSGAFTLVASNSSGTSSQVSSSANSLHVLSGDADDDGDGLTNAIELAIGTDPLNPSTAGDGITDGWKVFYGLNPLDPTLAAQDRDGDGLTNLQEFQLGTNPRLPDRVPPAVSRIFPADQATNYPLNGRIIVRFNEPLLVGAPLASTLAAINSVAPTLSSTAKTSAAQVLQSYLQNTCCGNSVNPGVITVSNQGVTLPGNVQTSNDGLTVSFTPAQLLDVTTTYNVQVNGVRDAAGNLMTAPFLSSFTAGQVADNTAPFVQQTSPPNGTSNVPTNATFTLQFSKPMDPATLTPQLITLTDSETNQVATGTVQVDPSNTIASFIPNPPLLVGRNYIASLTGPSTPQALKSGPANPQVAAPPSSSALQDTDGNALIGSTTFFFTTAFDQDTDVPHLVASSPSSGDSNVPTNAVIMLEFNEPLSIIGASTNVQVFAAGQLVPGSIALSDANRRVVFTPFGSLASNTLHTVTVGPGITDLGGNLIDNPGSFSFQTGNADDTNQPLIVSVSPADGSTGVATNAAIQLQFSKPVSPLTVTALTFQVAPADLAGGGGGIGVDAKPRAKAKANAASAQSEPPGSLAGTLSVSADGLTATFTPSAPLATQTNYVAVSTSDILDVEGNSFPFSFTSFTTGGSPQTIGPAVVQISPQNGDTNIPVNARIVVKLNEPIEPASVGPNAITVSTGGVAVLGTINVTSDQSELFFTVASPLAVSTTYAVSVSGFTDVAGNPVLPFTSSFTTSASATLVTQEPQVLSVNPANGATGVPVNTNVVVTFDEGVDATTVNADTIQVQVAGIFGSVAGNYAVSGSVVTFTPFSPLPGNTQIQVAVSNVKDLAWTSTPPPPAFISSFTTGDGTDTARPSVVMVSPANGATNVGLNASVVLTFSKSVNPNTINTNTLALLAGGFPLGFALDISSDNRTVTLSPFGLLSNTVVTVIATSGILDFSGNALPDFRSQFTTSAGFDPTATFVVSQRPGNGATQVGLNSPVVLFLNKPLDPATVQDVVHVAQNGALAVGTLQVKDNGQTVEFTPAAPWQNGAFIEVFFGDLNSFGIRPGIAGFAATLVTVPPSPANLSSYQGSFTTVPDTTNIPPSLIAASPDGTIPAPLNAVIDLRFDQPLNPNTVNANTVLLENLSTGQFAAGTLTTDASGTIIRFKPTLPLVAGNIYSIQTTTGIQGLNGLPQNFNSSSIFTAGTSVDNLPPVVALVSPPDGSTQVPVNADIHVQFTEPVDPLTVNSATVLVTGGGQTVVASSITFNFNDNGHVGVVLTPQEPFPDNTVMTITISGLQDLAGNQVIARTTHFTTGAGPTTIVPVVLNTNPGSDSFDVPLNTLITLQTNVPVDPASVNSNTLSVIDDLAGGVVNGVYSTSVDGRTITFAPSGLLAAGRQYTVIFSIGDGVIGITDLAGNALTCQFLCNFNFTTAFTADNTPPTIVGISPTNQMTAVPINTQVLVQFNNPIDELTLSQVALSGANGPVTTIPFFANGQTTLTLTPLVPLTENSQYMLNVAGVQDLAGNTLASPVTSSFTTGNVADIIQPFVTLVSPLDGSNAAPLNTAVHVQFNKVMDPLTITPASFMVSPLGGSPVAGTLNVALDGKSATFTPAAPLASETTYTVFATNGITDLPGQALAFFSSSFTTGLTAQAAGPQVLNVSPLNGSSGAPVNTQVVAVVNEPVDPQSVNANSIVVAAGGITVPGTTSVNSDGTVLTFTPSALLAINTSYSVNISGFKDVAGNPAVPFSSSFTTGASAIADMTGPLVQSVSPPNGATGIPAASSVTIMFNELVNPITVNNSTFAVSLAGLNANLAGTYTVSGATATFVPVSPLPGNANIQITVYGVLDLAGNSNTPFHSYFATAAFTDSTSSQVVSVTPNDGANGIGLNASIVFTFSKSLNPATVNSNTIGILAGSSLPVPARVSISADNRVVTLFPGTLPPSTIITGVASSGIQDLSGNALADFRSQFTTSVGVDTTHASIVGQRPGNGATNVPLSSGIVLFANEPLDPVTVGTSLHVTQNGVELDGSVSVIDNGQTVRFRPAAPFASNALIQVFLLGTALDANGVPINSYQGMFQTAADTNNAPLVLVASSPAGGVSNVPLNAVVQLAYNTPLNASTVTNGTVFLFNQFGQAVPGTVTLDPSGEIITFTPASPLSANTFYFLEASGITAVNGSSTFSEIEFNTGAVADNTAPAVAVFSPADGSSNVPVNANIHLRFSEPINSLSVSAASVTIADANNIQIPASISFGEQNQDVLLVPQSVLTANSVITVTVAGVQDIAGNISALQIAHFTTGNTPATATPVVISSNPFNAASTVSVNSPVTIQANVPIDPVSVNSSSFQVRDNSTGQPVTGFYSVSPGGFTVNFVPGSPLGAGHNFFVFICNGITDLAGNQLQCFSFGFTTTITPSTTGPSVVGISPSSGATLAPINAQVVVEFDQPVDALTLGQITLNSGTGPLNVSTQVLNANQTVILTPVQPLNATTLYTLTVAGVQDLSGNTLASPVTSTFTTAQGADLSPAPAVANVNPPDGELGVPVTSTIQLHFSKVVDGLTVSGATFQVSNGSLVAATLVVSPDGLSATLTPSTPLLPSTTYTVLATAGITDLIGQGLVPFSSTFQTASGTPSLNVIAVSPSDTSTNVPVNAKAAVLLNESIDSTSLTQSSIQVSAGGAPVTGVITANSNGTRLVFAPNSNLAVNTTYTVQVSGVTDLSGNAIVPFNSSFTTAPTTVADTTPPTVLSVSPAGSSQNIPVDTSIVLTFSKPVDPTSVSSNTVPIVVNGFPTKVAGIYSVTGSIVTFTPASPLPGSAFIQVQAFGVLDASGNSSPLFTSSFFTAIVRVSELRPLKNEGGHQVLDSDDASLLLLW